MAETKRVIYYDQLSGNQPTNGDVIFVDNPNTGTHKMDLKSFVDAINNGFDSSIKSSGVSVSADNYSSIITNVNDQPVNSVYTYGAGLQSKVSNLPSNKAMTIVNFAQKSTGGLGQVMLAVERNGRDDYLYFRTIGGSPAVWSSWVKVANSADLNEEVSDLKSAIENLNEIEGIIKPALEIGNIGLNGTSLNYTENNVRVRTPQNKELNLPKGTTIGMSNFSDYFLRVLYAKADEYTYSNLATAFTLPYDAKVALCMWNKDLATPLSVSDASRMLYIDTGETIADKVTDISTNINMVETVNSFERANLIDKGLDENGIEVVNSIRICSDYISVTENEVVTFDAIGTKKIGIVVNFYTANDYTTPRTGYLGWFDNRHSVMIPTGITYIRFLVKYEDNSAIKVSDFSQAIMYRHSKDTVLDNYSVGVDFIRRNINLKHLGIISGLQSFCRYDGKYYSTDGAGGSHIFVQDADFNLINTVSLSIGHGNSFQLGQNGKAYISGWDDGAVYVVDLSTLSITETISLPSIVSSGYSTVAVDDINGLMYILYRSTYPDTVTNYDFVVWDYVNDEIKLTKKTIPIYAVQACDFYSGRIFVNYGLGNNPNGHLIFNTNGDVISELKINALENYEPQGVFFDRVTKQLLISYTSGHLYELFDM